VGIKKREHQLDNPLISIIYFPADESLFVSILVKQSLLLSSIFTTVSIKCEGIDDLDGNSINTLL